MSDIKIPDDCWDDDSEGAISTWFYEDGDRVSEGDVLCEVMNEKVATEIESSAAGTLKVIIPAETPVLKGVVIARIEP